jgi:hypothetical protein
MEMRRSNKAATRVVLKRGLVRASAIRVGAGGIASSRMVNRATSMIATTGLSSGIIKD